MKREIIRCLLPAVVFVLATGCNTMQTRQAGQEASMAGTWYLTDSNAKFRISNNNGVISIKGWDSSAGKKFEISDVSWDGTTLKFTSYMPITKWTVINTLRVVDNETLEGQRSGDSSGPVTYKREEPAP